MAELAALTQPSRKGISRFVSANAAPAPAPAVPPRPQGDLARASIEEIAQAVRTTMANEVSRQPLEPKPRRP
ncbi:hypothetical protein ACWGDX_00800 [Streptomyces sp. NPDC055025]